MRIEGTQKIDAQRTRVFAALIDPASLQKCIPGCQEMEKTGENEYNARLKAGVGPVKGVFTATVSLQEIIVPEHYKLVVDGKGQPGFAKGTGEFTLSEEDGGTSIQYAGEVHVGGLLASVGQRMIQATANMLAGRFFKALEKETKGEQEDATPDELAASDDAAPQVDESKQNSDEEATANDEPTARDEQQMAD